MDFLDFIRKVHQEKLRQERFILKGGKGSGWFGPPKGTHGKGKRKSKAKGFEGRASFSGHRPHGKRKPLGTAHYKGDITFDRKQYSALGNEARRLSVAHEVIHQTVEGYVLRDQKEWDRAEKLLTIATIKGGRRLFVGGNLRIGEAVSDAVASAMTNSKFGGISDEKWNDIKQWSKKVTQRAGYDWEKLKSDVGRLQEELDNQL